METENVGMGSWYLALLWLTIGISLAGLVIVLFRSWIKRRRINRMFKVLQNGSAREVIEILLKIKVISPRLGKDGSSYAVESLKVNCGTRYLGAAIATWLWWEHSIGGSCHIHQGVDAVTNYIFSHWSRRKARRFIKAMKRHKIVHDSLERSFSFIRKDPPIFVGAFESVKEDIGGFLNDLVNWCVQAKKRWDEKNRQSVIARGLEACGCEPEEDGQKAQ